MIVLIVSQEGSVCLRGPRRSVGRHQLVVGTMSERRIGTEVVTERWWNLFYKLLSPKGEGSEFLIWCHRQVSEL